MSWRMDSTAGACIWDTEPLGGDDLRCRNEEIAWLIGHERQKWGLINGRLAQNGEPQAYGTYFGVAAIPPPATLANVPSLNGEAALWTAAIYTPWLANSLVAPSFWSLHAQFQATTSTSPGNLTLNPRVVPNTVTVGGSSAGGIALGADAAITLTASITTNWIVDGNITVRSIGAPGANSTAYGDFNCIAKPATTGTGAATINDLFGYSSASFDASIAEGVVLGMANTVATITYAPTQIIWVSGF